MVAEFRQTDAQTPVVLMGYLNPVEARGIKAFSERAQQVGVDGVLLVDLAIEEAQDYVPVLRAHGLDCIFLLVIGSASCRERVCQYGSISVVAGSLKKKKM